MSETIPEDIRAQVMKIYATYFDANGGRIGEDPTEGELIAVACLAAMAERERCAKIAESHDHDDRSNWGRVIAKAIRGEIRPRAWPRALSKAGTE